MPITIFLVEDNPADIVLVREALLNEGLSIDLIVAEDGSSALGLLSNMGSTVNCPDLAIIDLNLPKVGGAELLTAIRENSLCANIPAVVMTSSRSPADLTIINKLGGHYFHKPLELTEYFKIGQLVASLLPARSSASAN